LIPLAAQRLFEAPNRHFQERGKLGHLIAVENED
jgi:hypothetical protein